MKPDIIKLRRPVLILKILTKLYQNTSRRVTYVLTTKKETMVNKSLELDFIVIFFYN